MTEEEAYHELCAYTLSHGDAAFIHQHVVDAYMAQHATDATKPIGTTFALVGLYLLIEKHYSGKQVQQVHMKLSQRKEQWPHFTLPKSRGAITSMEVVAAPAGPQRDQAIHAWCASVWSAFAANR